MEMTPSLATTMHRQDDTPVKEAEQPQLVARTGHRCLVRTARSARDHDTALCSTYLANAATQETHECNKTGGMTTHPRAHHQCTQQRRLITDAAGEGQRTRLGRTLKVVLMHKLDGCELNTTTTVGYK